MKNKFAFFVIATHLGGAERSLLDFVIPFNQGAAGHMKVVVPKAEGPLVDQLKSQGIEVVVLPMPKTLLSLSRQKMGRTLILAIPAAFQLIYYLMKLSSFLRREKFTVIHSTGLKYHIFLGLLAPFFSFKLYLHLRDFLTNRWLISFFSILDRSSRIHLLANSKATAAPLNHRSVQVIYNGFDPNKFFPAHNTQLKRKLHIPEDGLLVGTVGAIARWKGQREFIEMAVNLCHSYDRAYFLVVGSEIYDTLGDKGELAKLKQIVKDAQLEKRILFLEFQEDITSIYNGIDIFVHCSIAPEPFGRVVVEALLCGCPVVAANAGGPKEIIEHQNNGLLYRMGSLQEMQDSVESLLSQESLRNKLADCAPNIKERFSLSLYQEQMRQTLASDI